jgi:hypothetical protein
MFSSRGVSNWPERGSILVRSFGTRDHENFSWKDNDKDEESTPFYFDRGK